MRINQPVTQIETILPDNLFIYSTTDLTGVITSVNDAFTEISGFSREELIGAPHNIVRHPDVPPAAFEDLWRDLQAGKPWCGLVKNRRKDGGYYWVEANASPIRENGKVVGYGSVRRKPSREAVAAAEAIYARIRQGDSSLAVRSGRPWSSGILAPLARLGLISRMRLAMGAGLLATLGLLASAQSAQPTLLWSCGGVLLASLLLSQFFWLPRLRNDLRVVAEEVQRMQRNGDFAAHVSVKGHGLLSEVSQGINALAIDVETVLHETQNSARRVADGANGLRQAMLQVSAAQNSLGTSSAATAATLEQITVAINEAAMNAAEGVEASAENQRISDSAGREAENAVGEIGRIADRLRAASDAVSTLSQRSQEIGHMASVIKEIADQTNLLALNAAIEAARAGEQGRGFAVVADEVRKLAERTTSSTADISLTVNEIQAVTAKAVSSMELAAQEVETGIGMLRQSVAGLEGITHSSSHVSDMAGQISDAARQQGIASEEVANSMQQITDLIEQNTTSAQSAKLAADELLRTAHQLDALIAGFELYRK